MQRYVFIVNSARVGLRRGRLQRGPESETRLAIMPSPFPQAGHAQEGYRGISPTTLFGSSRS